jgi:hypothetical protein
MPKPGPEHQRLHYNVGKWNVEMNMKESPFGPAGKVTGVYQNEMFPGGFFLIMRFDGKGHIGELNGLAIMGYNAEKKVYTYHDINNWGETGDYEGMVQGDTWTWTSEIQMGDKMVKSGFTLKEVSPTSYTSKFEISTDGSTWITTMEGKGTKATPVK